MAYILLINGYIGVITHFLTFYQLPGTSKQFGSFIPSKTGQFLYSHIHPVFDWWMKSTVQRHSNSRMILINSLFMIDSNEVRSFYIYTWAVTKNLETVAEGNVISPYFWLTAGLTTPWPNCNFSGWGGVGWGWWHCLVIAHMVDATQLCLSCHCTHGGCYATVLVLSLHTWWMLRNCACLVIAHMVDATQLCLSCNCTHGGCYATVLVL